MKEKVIDGDAGAGESQTAKDLEALVHDARQLLEQAVAAADRSAHQSPWQAIGVAAGVGLLLGLLVGRR